MAPKVKSEKDGYQVNIELKDQLNNVFYIDKINDKDSIMLKDYSFDDTTTTGTTNIKYINIFRDIYYLDNTVIQDLKTIFIKHTKDPKHSNKGTKPEERSYDYIDTREPIGYIDNLMKKTNMLSQIHKIFTTEEYSKLIRDNIIHFNSGTNSRVKQLNSKDAINKYVVDYYKYINNTKKTSDFDDDEKMDALMFYNVMYMLRNIYLKKQTILTNIQGEKFYVDEILFYDLPYIHMVKKDYDKPKKINIYLRIKTIPIIGIPIIKIHYIVDDLEVKSLKLSAPREFKPVDLDKDFAKYSTMYIFDNFKYKQETDSMTAFFNSLKSEKRIDKIQELFFNADIVNKYKKRYYEQHKPKNKQEQDKKPRETATTEEAEAAKLAATLKAAEAAYDAATYAEIEALEALKIAAAESLAAAAEVEDAQSKENRDKAAEATKVAEQARLEAEKANFEVRKANRVVRALKSKIKAKAKEAKLAEEAKSPAEKEASKKAAKEKEEKEKAEKEKAAREKAAETIKYNNINANILYLLRENFNLIDNKISIDNTSIDDTYIAYDISDSQVSRTDSNQSSVTVKYHSIMTNKKYDKYTNPKKEAIIKNIIAEHLKRFTGAKYKDDNFFYEDNRTDERLPATVYNIIVIFRTFKQDSAKKKPSLMRRYIGDECLSNAVELDDIFSKLFYRTLGLPDKYLYDKFVNLTSKRTSATTSATTSAPNIPGLPNIPIPSATKGGKKNNTKKFRTKKFRAKKHNTRKYKVKRFRTKKVRTKLLNAL